MILKRNERQVYLFPKEAAIFEVLSTRGPSTSVEVNDHLNGEDLLQTMRLIHQLESRGFLTRTEIDGRKLFKIKPQVKSMRIFARPRTLSDR
jgi:hypothetical protein